MKSRDILILKLNRKNGFFAVLFSLFCFLTGTAQQLESYIQIAEDNNPQIQAFNISYEIAEEKVKEVNSFPDTEFGVGYFVREPETRTGPQKAKFSVKQMLPWFGSITARENYASSLADAQYVEIALAKRQLGLEVAEAYYRLYANREQQEVLLENISLLNTYHELALNSLEVGSASAVDVLRIQMRQNDLEQQNKSLQQEFEGEIVLFNKLLNREKDAAVVLVDSLIIPKKKNLEEAEIAAVHPELLKYDKLYESIEEAQILNKKDAAPKLGFGVDYVSVAKSTTMQSTDNGKDIVMPMISVSVPIFNNKYKSITRQNKLKQRELSAQREQRLNLLQTKLAEAVRKRNSARIKVSTSIANLEQSNDAQDILIKSYETGTMDFKDVLEIQNLELKFQINLLEAVKDYYLQAAKINYLSN